MLDCLDEVTRAYEQEISANRDRRHVDYLPTPREIAAQCAKIRAAWSRSERERRSIGLAPLDAPPVSWQPPLVDTSAFRNARGIELLM